MQLAGDLRHFLVNASHNGRGDFLVRNIGRLANGDGMVCEINTSHERAGDIKFTVMTANGKITMTTWQSFDKREIVCQAIDGKVPSRIDADKKIVVEVNRFQDGRRCVSFAKDFQLPDDDEFEGYESLEQEFWAIFSEFYLECAVIFSSLRNIEQLADLKTTGLLPN